MSDFHEEISFAGLKWDFASHLIRRALKDAERYMSLQKTQQHVEKAYEDLIILDNLVVLAERVTTLVISHAC